MNNRKNITKTLDMLDSVLGLLFKVPKLLGKVLIFITGSAVGLVKAIIGLITGIYMSVMKKIRSIKNYIVTHSVKVTLIIAFFFFLIAVGVVIKKDIM